jgi:hypothetical protein
MVVSLPSRCGCKVGGRSRSDRQQKRVCLNTKPKSSDYFALSVSASTVPMYFEQSNKAVTLYLRMAILSAFQE